MGGRARNNTRKSSRRSWGGWRHFTGLHALVEWGYAGLLEKFSDEAARVDDQNSMVEEKNPGTLLCHACEQALPRLDVIKVLVGKVKVDVNRVSNKYHCV